MDRRTQRDAADRITRGARATLRAARSIAAFLTAFLAAFGFLLAAGTPAFASGTTCTQTAATWSDLQTYFSTPTGNCIALGATITNPSNQILSVASGQAVTLDLAGNSLTISGITSGFPAIRVLNSTGTSLTIEDSSGGSGQLSATGGPTAAGIGGNGGSAAIGGLSAGQVTITGGTVTAAGAPGTSPGPRLAAGARASGAAGVTPAPRAPAEAAPA